MSPCPHLLYFLGGFEYGAYRACKALGPLVHEVPTWSRRESGVGMPGAQGGLRKGLVLRLLGRWEAEWLPEDRTAELTFEVVPGEKGHCRQRHMGLETEPLHEEN